MKKEKPPVTRIPLIVIPKGSKIRCKKSDAIKYLEFLAFEAKRIRYPSIEQEYLAKVEFTDKTANGLTKCITSFIQLIGGQAERISTTGRPIDRTKIVTDVLGHQRSIGSINWIPGTTTNGSADISATISGRSIKIEVKIGRDKQSEAQRKYQKEIEQAGGYYYIAQDFTSFLHWYNLNFAL